MPMPPEVGLVRAFWMTVIRLFTVSATYSAPLRLIPTPVGPITNASGSVFSAKFGPDDGEAGHLRQLAGTGT